jgi:nucleoside-diphosphate-sugar epimerase
MRVLVVGRGFMGRQLSKYLPNSILCSHEDAIYAIKIEKPPHVFNCTIQPEMLVTKLSEKGKSFDDLLLAAIEQSETKYVYLSTRMVYARERQFGAKESDLCAPISLYGENKLLAECAIKSRLPSSNYLIMRLPNVFGHELNEKRNSFFKVLLTNLIKKRKIFFDFDPALSKDFLSVRDFTKISHQMLLRDISGIYNVSYGAPVYCNWIIETLCQEFSELDVVIEPTKHAEPFYLNSENLRAAIDFQDIIGFREEFFDLLSKYKISA